MGREFERVKALVVLLTEEEKRKLRALLDQQLGLHAKAKGRPERGASEVPRSLRLFYTCVTNVLKARTTQRFPPLDVFLKQNAGSLSVKSLAEAHEFLEGTWERLCERERVSDGEEGRLKGPFFSLFARMAAEYITTRTPAPLTLKTVLQQAQNFLAISDVYFPLYAANGMLIRSVLFTAGRPGRPDVPWKR